MRSKSEIGNSKPRLWKKTICLILSLIMAFGTFVSMTVGNFMLSDWIDFRNLITAEAAVLPSVPILYRHGELVGVYTVNYEDNTKLQYKIGDNGTWTNYSVPFAIPAHKTTKVYARVGTTGRPIYMQLSNTKKALGVYTESDTDFEFSYNGIDFGYTRTYNSVDKNWFESIHAGIAVTNSRLEVSLPDGSIYPMIRNGDNTYIDELNGYTLTKTDTDYIFDDGQYKYYYAYKPLQTTALLSAIEDYSGNRLDLNRSVNTDEISISDSTGRSFAVSDYQAIKAPDDSEVNYYSQKTITDPNGNKLEYTTKYDQYIQIKDQARVILGKYEYKNELYDYTLTKSNDKSIEYYDNGRLKQITYDNGAWEKYTYDDENMTYATLKSNGETTKTIYNNAFLPVEYTDEFGITTAYTYDEHYRIKTEKTEDNTTTYSYDSKGNVLSYITGDTENDTYNTYDSNGNLVREKKGDNYTYYTYDANKNKLINATLKKDYCGNIPDVFNDTLSCFDITRYTYDSKGRVEKEEYSNGDIYEYEYDSVGNITKKTTRIIENGNVETNTIIYTYDELGNLLTTLHNDDSISYINDSAGRTLLTKDNDQYTRIVYDNQGRIKQKIEPEDYDISKEGLPNNNTYSDPTAGHTYVYGENGNLISETNRLGVTTNYEYYPTGEKKQESFDIYQINYTSFGDIENVKVAGKTIVSYVYNENNDVVSENYANGQSKRFEYNEYGSVIKQYQNDNVLPCITYTYNDDGELTEKIDFNSGLKYVYDENCTNIYKFSDNSLLQSYSENDIENEEEFGRQIVENNFSINSSSIIKDNSIVYSMEDNIIEYNSQVDDKLNRISDYIKFANNTAISSNYKYENDIITEKEFNTVYKGENYTFSHINQYNDKGMIIATGYDSINEYFTYDNSGQLIRVDNNNSANGYTAIYSYDDRGNILSKNIYDYTREENITSAANLTTVFTYANQGWSDVLTSVNSVPLNYDANGNVVSFGDRYFEWVNGHDLKEISENDNTYSYTYDESGIRNSKTINGTTTYFNTKEGVIVSQSDGTDTFYFQYDNNGIPIGFIYNDEQYFYLTNLLGDVIGITDKSGECLVAYEYDEWGNVLEINTAEVNSSEQLELANLNPLRYRGYYYDNETGYYYLQYRYYDPNICRFLNSDSIDYVDINKKTGTNLFAYCGNDPVNNHDPSGHIILTLIIIWAIVSSISVKNILSDYYTSTYFKCERSVSQKLKKQGYNDKGKIAIPLEGKTRFVNAIYEAMDINNNQTFTLLAQYARSMFKRTIKRDFLFNEACVAKEIEFHVKGWMYANKFPGVNTPPDLWYDSPAQGGYVLANSLKSHCSTIDILENDAYDTKQRVAFGYFDGVIWKSVVKDPYWNRDNGKRKASYVSNNWKKMYL